MLSLLPFLILPLRLPFQASAYVVFTSEGGKKTGPNVTQHPLTKRNKALCPQTFLL